MGVVSVRVVTGTGGYSRIASLMTWDAKRIESTRHTSTSQLRFYADGSMTTHLGRVGELIRRFIANVVFVDEHHVSL